MKKGHESLGKVKKPQTVLQFVPRNSAEAVFTSLAKGRIRLGVHPS